MSYQRSVELEQEDRTKKRPEVLGAEPVSATPFARQIDGPVGRSPSALLHRQAVLGNAHLSRVFRSAAPEAAGPEAQGGPKKDCDCPDEEHCTCPK
jgi:hypothetical protein